MLNDRQSANLKPRGKPYRVSDRGGLFVEVRPNGAKLWRHAYRYGGKQKLLSLGCYPDTSLALARITLKAPSRLK